MKEKVYLKTTYLVDNRPHLISGGYDEEDLDRWITHRRKEGADGMLMWEKCNKDGEVL